MRKVLCSLLALGTFIVVCAQDDYKKPATLTINFTGTDFKSAAAIRKTSLSTAIDNKQLGLQNVWSGFGISYLQGIHKNIDFVGSLNGTFVYYPFRNETVNVSRTRHLLLAVDAGINVKLFSDQHAVVPYLNAAIGGYNYSGVTGAYAPLGAGVQFNVKHKVYILVSAQYRIPITVEANYHYFYNLGVGIPLKKSTKSPRQKPSPEDAPPPNKPVNEPVVVVKPVVIDTDGDGILDDVDKCPTTPGLTKYKGCPIPDTDGDGVNDEEDRCPTVPGLAKYNGCPIPDTDGDGVNDEMDKCPTVPGPISNGGCPSKAITAELTKKVEMAAKEIYFETAKAVLLPKSFPKLDAVVAIMKANTTLKLEIDGHTDNVGTIEHNQTLSENRAAAVAAYFVSKGISSDRLVSKGFGSSVPIDTNATPAGKAKNRRVEMKISE